MMEWFFAPVLRKKGGDIMTTFEEVYLFLTFCLVIIKLLSLIKK